MKEKIGLHIVGGLGDVCLTRKYNAVCGTDLIGKFDVLSIADVYEEQQIKDNDRLDRLFDTIKKYNIKGKIDPKIETVLKNHLLNSINYHQLDQDNPELPSSFFDNVNKNDVIDISVPNKFHLNLVEQVLKKHGHMIVEKPAVHSMDDVTRLRRSITDMNMNGRIIMDAEHYSHYGNVKHYINDFKRISRDKRQGYGLGKINSIELRIEENEGFASERNRGIIEIKKSGGGIWLDTGIHAIAFLRNIGAIIDHSSVNAQPYKSRDAQIQDNKYGETRMDVSFNIQPSKYFSDDCNVSINVAKSCELQHKRFVMHYENGRVEIDIPKKSVNGFNKNGAAIFDHCVPGDAFYHVFEDMRKNIEYNQEPLTSVTKSIENIEDIFLIYGRAKPLIKLKDSKTGPKKNKTSSRLSA
ncbi:hypothetical protein CMI38_01755 [Candidatus Pacearchaeota archaeon]|nr:hypothetical protein [Candidatus Pacearchaeota archaeon]|tara:strand:- start:1750 stop:2982 length:1233 start_codon:yes stop_codon:yes gene_type:complete